MTSAKKAFDRVMYYLSQRDHSVKELTQKLARYHEKDEIEAAIQKADEYGYLADPKVISQRLAGQLARKGKGQRYINNYLKNKGLPIAEVAEEEELQTGRGLVERNLKFSPPYDLKQKQKIFRYLSNRGFRSAIVKLIINEK